jgi:hypothetical protein
MFHVERKEMEMGLDYPVIIRWSHAVAFARELIRHGDEANL